MRAVPSFFIEKFDAELPEVVKNLYFSLNTYRKSGQNAQSVFRSAEATETRQNTNLRKAKVIFGHHFLRRIKSNG